MDGSLVEHAPGELELVRTFVNTLDVENGADAIGEWLGASGLLGVAELQRADLDRARRVREALREALLVHHGEGAHDDEALARLNAEAGAVPLALELDSDGVARLRPGGQGLDAALGRLFAIVARASAEGTFTRLKVCPADTCLVAFYDRSRNGSRTWCSMAVCGNRAKARSYRTRQRPV